MNHCLYLSLLVIASFVITHSDAQGIGINYGLLGDNLPTPDKVVALLKSRNIRRIRIFDPNPDVLKALEGALIEVILGVPNEDLQQLASDPSAAAAWVNTNVKPHTSVPFRYIAAGNEVIPGTLASFVPGAIDNLNTALIAASIAVPVTTAISFEALSASYPPSNGTFSDSAIAAIQSVVSVLVKNQSPSLLVNVYPYFAYASDPTNIRKDYVLFTASGPVVFDGGLQYDNMFDAMVDAVYAALEKVGGQNLDIVVSESGWPSAGNGDIATIANAQTYVNNMIAHVTSGKGTPKKPKTAIEAYIFALFNENQKTEGVEQNFGIYYPDTTEVYHVNLP